MNTAHVVLLIWFCVYVTLAGFLHARDGSHRRHYLAALWPFVAIGFVGTFVLYWPLMPLIKLGEWLESRCR